MLEIQYNGTDLVISKDTIEEQLGYRPGDTLRVVIPNKYQLKPIPRLPDEIERMRAGLEAVAGSWNRADVDHFQKVREELWAEWQIPKSV